MGVTFVQTQEGVRVEPRVHAREHGDALRGWKRQVSAVEVGRVILGVLEELVRDAHRSSRSGVQVGGKAIESELGGVGRDAVVVEVRRDLDSGGYSRAT